MVVLYHHGGGGGTGRPLLPFVSGGTGSSSFVVLGPCHREWVVVLGPHCCSSVVVVGPHHCSCMVVWGLTPCSCMHGGAGSLSPFVGDSAGPLCMVVWGLVRRLLVRVMGCCLCLWALITVHGCPWAVITVCALSEVVDGGGAHLLGDVALLSFLLWWLWVMDVCDSNY